MSWDELLRKLKGQAEPTIGEVKTQPEERFLNARPVMEPGYGEDQDTYQHLKDMNRIFAEKGYNLGNPTQEDLDNYKRIQDAAGSTGGMTRAVRNYGSDVGKLLNRVGRTIEAPGSSEKIIKDLSELSNFKRNPDEYEKIGSGLEKEVFRQLGADPASTRVIKVPKARNPLNTPRKEQMIFNKLNDIGLDPNTRTIETSQRAFQLQDPVKTFSKLNKNELDSIVPRDLKSANELNNKIDLENAKNEADYFDNKITAEQLQQLFERNNQIQTALKEADPRVFQRANVEKSIIRDTPLKPDDLHEYNIGFDKLGKSKVLDAGMIEFPNNAEAAQREAVQKLRDSYRSLPNKSSIGTREPTQDEIDQISKELYQDRNTQKINLPPFIKLPWERSSK